MAINKVELEVSLRTGVGKGASRASRRNGIIPAVIYGANKPAIIIELNPKQLMAQAKIKGFKTRQFVLKIADGEEELTLCQNIQYHKVKDTPLHVDFLRIDPKKEITLDIPVEIIGTDGCKGIKEGGLLNLIERHIELHCLPANIPSSIIIDISKLEIADTVTMTDVKLPEGTRLAVKITEEHNPTILTINPPEDEEVIETTAPVAGEVPSEKGKEDTSKSADEKSGDSKKDSKKEEKK